MDFIPEVSESTQISWWNENRKKLNEAIRWYNEYVEKSGHSRDAVLAKVRQTRQYGHDHGFSDWQFDILEDIKDRVEGKGDVRS